MSVEAPVDVQTGAYSPLVNALDSWHAEVVLAEPEARVAFFGGLSFAAYQQWLMRVNSLIRPGEPKGYIPDGFFNFQRPEGGTDSNQDTEEVMYCSLGYARGKAIHQAAFEAAQNMDDLDAALAMLGIVQVGIHRMHNGHTRTNAVGRQLLAPEGRGYSGANEDRAYYDQLLTDKTRYLEQSLHPIKADLITIYARAIAAVKAERMEFEGPTPVAVPGAIGDTYRQLPGWWSHWQRRQVSILLNEPDFAALTILEYLDIIGAEIGDFLDPDAETPTFSLAKLALSMYALPGEETISDIDQAHDTHKANFLRAIVDCIAHGDESIFGSPEKILDKYKLPEPSR